MDQVDEAGKGAEETRTTRPELGNACHGTGGAEATSIRLVDMGYDHMPSAL